MEGDNTPLMAHSEGLSPITNSKFALLAMSECRNQQLLKGLPFSMHDWI